jgi:phospholipid transport system transporter-binding protein
MSKKAEMLRLPAVLTHAQASSCLRDLAQTLNAEPGAAVLDASALTTFDSSALAVLLELQRVGTRLGKSLEVLGLPAQLVALATLYGVQSLLGAGAVPAPVDARAAS